MPVFMPDDDEVQAMVIPGQTAFKFSGTRPEKLGASEFTLVNCACDISTSVKPFQKDLSNLVCTVVEACKKNDRAENLLFRLIVFNEHVTEVHGFIELKNVQPDDYKNVLNAEGWTALYDASFNAIGACHEYARTLIQQDYDCNGATYIITDGVNNRGSCTPRMIAEEINKAQGKEEIESHNIVLIGLHNPKLYWEKEVKESLEYFQKEANITKFVDAGAATPQKLAKLAEWVSQSVSSQSQVLGQGQPSQLLNF
jgi:uncharacterized protein YegL